MRNNRGLRIGVAFALLSAHVGLFIGGAIAVEIGRLRFFGLFLYAAAALLVFDILLLLTDRWTVAPVNSSRMSPGPQALTDGRAIGILLCVTVASFAILGRGALAYLFAALAGAALLFQVTYRDRVNVGWTLVLAGVLTALLLLSKVHTVSYLIQTFDTVKHAEMAESIAASARTNQFENTRFQGFLFFHILVASLVQIITLSARNVTSFLFALLFPVSIVATYAFLSRRRIGQRLSLLAAVLLAVSTPLLIWGSKAHYQSLSFVFFTIVLLLVGGRVEKRRAVLIGLPVFAAWVSTHHLSVMMGAVLLSILASHEIFSTLRESRELEYVPILLYTIIGAKWSILTLWVATPLIWLTKHSPRASRDLGSTGLLVEIYTTVEELLVMSIPFFLDYLHLSLLLAVSGLGVLALISTRRKFGVLLAGATLGGIFYFPNPLWVPLRGLGALLRWNIMAQPLVVVVSAAGMFALIRGVSRNKIPQPYVSMPFVVALLFFMIAAGFYSPVTSDFIDANRYDRQSLTNQDIAAAEWVQTHASDVRPVYATSKLVGYLTFTSEPVLGQGKKEYRRARITRPGGRVIFPRGLTVFQREAFQSDAIKMALSPKTEYYSHNVTIAAAVNAESVNYNPNTANLVYSNNDTVIHKSG